MCIPPRFLFTVFFKKKKKTSKSVRNMRSNAYIFFQLLLLQFLIIIFALHHLDLFVITISVFLLLSNA